MTIRVLAAASILTVGTNLYLYLTTRRFLYSDVAAIPATETCLVLGTSKTTDGLPNAFFEYRMNAAAELYWSGKCKGMLLSGDNSRRTYNEPEDMRQALLKRGVPYEAMVLDYAGLRTFDSIARAKAVFGQTKVTIVSQQFHNYRAVFLARQQGIDAAAFNAKNVTLLWSLKTEAREIAARTVAFLDSYVWNRKARFYGKVETIRLASAPRRFKSSSKL